MSDILATKYRPKKLSDMIGQDHAVKILTNTILYGNLHHSYIFAGFFGSGKTSAARVFAASLNSPSGPTLDPDMSSPVVQEIFEGKSIDVMEMDAASNRGIDEIRNLREEIKFSPIHCRYRFVVLDESHALTDIASEAALKMVEEPPKNTIFIFATTDPQNMIPTIRSRSMTIKFNKVQWGVLHKHLCKVADAEGVSYDPDALKIAARRSSGSVRNSLQNLQTLITFAGKEKITLDIANEALQYIDESKFFDLLDAIIGVPDGKPNAAKGYKVIEDIMADGRDIGEILDNLTNHFRHLLLISTCSQTSGLLYLTEDEKKRYVHQRQKIGNSANSILFISQMIDLIAECNKQIMVNLNPQAVLENFVIKAILSFASINKSQ
jgi:DNA polymerase-3 subunit gamma/tau